MTDTAIQAATDLLPRVIQITEHLFHVKSGSEDYYYPVVYVPGEKMACPCIRGRMLAKSTDGLAKSTDGFTPKSCSHMRAAIDHLRDQTPPAPITLEVSYSEADHALKGELGGDDTETTARYLDAFGESGPDEVVWTPDPEDLERMRQEDAQADAFERERENDERMREWS